MKNKILTAINILMVISFLFGICLLDSTGTAFVVAICMTMIPVAWGITFLSANRGRI